MPAVTSVLLCTKAETGVGALIAMGNQLLNGACALFVKQPKIKIIGLILNQEAVIIVLKLIIKE